jgi:hypothetical protein
MVFKTVNLRQYFDPDHSSYQLKLLMLLTLIHKNSANLNRIQVSSEKFVDAETIHALFSHMSKNFDASSHENVIQTLFLLKFLAIFEMELEKSKKEALANLVKLILSKVAFAERFEGPEEKSEEEKPGERDWV